MRGADINYNPVFFSYAIITIEDVRYVYDYCVVTHDRFVVTLLKALHF